MISDNTRRRKEGRMRVGMKQTLQAVEQGMAEKVFVAQDADPRMVKRIVQLCGQRSIEVTYVDTMRNLGKACGIDVGAAMAALVVDAANKLSE